MLKEERHQIILNKLHVYRKVLSTKLSEELNVSEDTVRRDLKELESKRLLYKVHGGALSIENKIKTYDERSIFDIDKKKIIAQKAVKLIHDGQVIIMSGSTTNLQLAKIIPPKTNVTIFTYSLPIALELTHHPSIEVIFIGGKLNKGAQVTTGIDVINSISNIRADMCFMGTGGIDTVRGFTEPDWEVSHIKKTMIDVSDYVVAMSTSDKIMKVERYAAAPIHKIDTIITEKESTDPMFEGFKELGITVI